MGKIVKYCSSCDEGFAERFGFCPDCGAPLQAFEMNPVSGDMVPEVKAEDSSPTSYEFQNEAEIFELPAEPVDEFITEAEPISFAEDTSEIEPEPIHKAITAEVPAYSDEVDYDDNYPAADTAADAGYSTYSNDSYDSYVPEDDYHVTVIEEKNVQQRNGLLLGATVMMIVALLTGTVYSLFSKELSVGAIGDPDILAYVGEIVDDPMQVEEEKKKADDDGGGGGGGREDKDPVNRGDLADQTKDPIRPPDAKVHRMDNPALVMPPPSTEGSRKFPKVYDQWGDPDSRFGGLSNGPGTGGGMGTGSGRGQGSGTGTGTGSGSGSGYGSGNGDGDGSGTGSGVGAPPKRPAGVTQKFRLIAKPKATYTDPARQNSVQGNVTLRVQLLASGQVGSITPVSRLPYGLTEQAIAAARQIKFEPAKRDGVAVTTTVTFQYSFTIY